jgi:hypothetical protein
MSLRDLLGRCLREPLVHFVVLGGAFFALHAAVAPAPRDGRVVISGDFVAGLRREHQGRTGRPPTVEEERALVDRFVDEEVLYREAVALGLDRGDPIVRRRLAQKMVFVAEDGAAREPADAELAAYLAAHADRYCEAGRASFRHVFLGRDRRGPAAEADARQLLAALQGGAPAEAAGDPFLQGAAFARRTAAEIEAVFGAAFAAALPAAPLGTWSGPIASSFGVHLVRVEAREPGGLPPLAAVRGRVRADLLDERRGAAVREMRERLRARYHVEIQAPAARVAGGPEATR